MKQIETLLQRYRNGEITPEEQAELNRLTHRDEILHAAASLLIYTGIFYHSFAAGARGAGNCDQIRQSGQLFHIYYRSIEKYYGMIYNSC